MAYAALILSHNISALIFSPFLLLYLLFGFWRDRRATRKTSFAPLLRSAAALLLAFALAETLLTALVRWPRDGLPDNPAAWLVTVARRKALDRLRRDRTLADKTVLLADLAGDPFDDPAAMDETPIPDERLKLLFTCCLLYTSRCV